jgi:murein DD-endopeptidase MepM/ murein hydrolase activator NlpD
MTRSGGTQFHGGLDMRASKGEGLKATLPGTVVYANQNHKSDEYSGRRRGSGTHRPTTGYGNAVVIEYKIENDFTVKGKYGKEDVHLTKGQSVYIKYTHMDNIDVKVGDEVKMGDLLGQAGATGNPGLYKGVWGLPNFENRHTHFEVSTVNQGGFFPKSAIIDPRPFIKTEIDDNGKVLD